jgi:predicted metal-dependent peptidase
VTVDDRVSPDELAHYKIAGYGGSDMSPAMVYLADDPEVEAAVVLTDGYISYPASPMPYTLLWALTPGGDALFNPPYGQVLRMKHE